MTKYFEADLERYSAILSDNLQDVATELRTIDLVDIVSYIRYGSFATLDDLVQSSTELFFRSGTISFAWTARVELGWEEPPIVTVGMEFRHHAISVFFDLTLRADQQSVKVCGILFDDPVGTPAEKLGVLASAIAAARMPASAVEPAHTRPASQHGRG